MIFHLDLISPLRNQQQTEVVEMFRKKLRLRVLADIRVCVPAG